MGEKACRRAQDSHLDLSQAGQARLAQANALLFGEGAILGFEAVSVGEFIYDYVCVYSLI